MMSRNQDHGSEIQLSAVIITRNERSRISDCIESVLAACRSAVERFELILVDSASADGTVELAAEYPITVLRIPEKHTVSCGAGRYLGSLAARGALQLHVDGDAVLAGGWLTRAVDCIRTENAVAGVTGYLGAVPSDTPTDVAYINGVMLFDAAPLAAVGGFDPFLLGYEDVELGYRLRDAGYRLVRLPVKAADHPEPNGVISEPLRRWHDGFYAAAGQAIRKSAGVTGILSPLVVRQRYKIGLLCWLSVGAAGRRFRTAQAGWLLATLLGVVALSIRLGPRAAARFLLTKTLGLAGLVVGLSKPTPAREQFPTQSVEVRKRASPADQPTVPALDQFRETAPSETAGSE